MHKAERLQFLIGVIATTVFIASASAQQPAVTMTTGPASAPQQVAIGCEVTTNDQVQQLLNLGIADAKLGRFVHLADDADADDLLSELEALNVSFQVIPRSTYLTDPVAQGDIATTEMVADRPIDPAGDPPEKDGDLIADLLSPQGLLLSWQTIFTDGFEGAWYWTRYGNPTWSDTSYRGYSGTWSAWCADYGLSPPGPYASNMDAWMIYGPFDLSDATDAQVTFYFWLDSEPTYDYFKYLASGDATTGFTGFQRASRDQSWQARTFSLSDHLGDSSVYFAFKFESDGIVQYEGAYVDDVVIEKNVVIKENTIMTAYNVTTKAYSSFVMSAKLEEASFPYYDISGKTVKFYIDSGYRGSGVTDGNGTAYYSDYSYVYPAGTYTITAQFDGDASYNGSQDTATLTVNKLNVTVTAYNATLNQPNSTTLSGHIENEYGNNEANKLIKFYVNNVYAGEDASDSSGNAAINYPWSTHESLGFGDGTYTIKAQYDGGHSWNPDSDTATLTANAGADLEVRSVNAHNGTYHPGDLIDVDNEIKNIGGLTSNNYTVDFYASINTTITTGDYKIGHVSRAGPPPNATHNYVTSCYFPPNSYDGSPIPYDDYYIGLIVTCSNDVNSGNDKGYDGSTVPVVPVSVRVHGTMGYRDRNNGWHPSRYALVKVYDDNLIDRTLTETSTDANGAYDVTVANDESDGLDIYVKVFTEAKPGAYPGTSSGICNVKDDIFSTTWFLESSIYDNYRADDLPVSITASNSGGAFSVYDSLVEGFHKAYSVLGVELGEITTWWPTSQRTSFYCPGLCIVPDPPYLVTQGLFILQDDRWDRDVIMHEYGHYITDIYNFAEGDVGSDNDHYWASDLRYNPTNRTDEQARNLAFREAWPTLFSISAQYGDTGDPSYDDTDDVWISNNLEKDTRLHLSPGQYYESMNCCALWDIFDNTNDNEDDNDTLSDTALSKIWDVSRYDQPDDIIDFWNGWFGRYGYAREITRIYLDHRMTFIAQKPAGPVPADGATNHSITVNLNWDDANNATSYDVYFGTDSTPDSGEYLGNTGSNFWNLGTLQYGTTYYWQIISKDGKAEAEGPVWLFTTGAAPPDTIDPTVTISSPIDGQSFTSSPIPVNGAASDPGSPSSGVSLVEVRVNAGSWQAATGTNGWNASVNLSVGSNTIEARSQDGAGNYSTVALVNVTYNPPDITTPTVTINSPTEGQSFTSLPIPVNGTASDPGSPSSGVSLVEVRVNSGSWQTSTGTTNWNVSVNLSVGNNTIEARSQDGAGNYSTVALVNVTYNPPDITNPTVTISSPTEGQSFTSLPIPVNGAASDPGSPSSGVSLVEVRVNSGSWQTASGTTNWNHSVNLSAGSNTIEARSQDGAGNYSTVALVNVTYQPAPVYDLDGDNFVGPGDFSLFACCWDYPTVPERCGGVMACADADFDCDGVVGSGDLSFFTTAWLLPADDPIIVYPSCGGVPGPGATPVTASPVSLDLALRAVPVPSGQDTVLTLPASIASVAVGATYFVEIWAGGAGHRGVTSAYADLNWTGALPLVTDVGHGGVFGTFASGEPGPSGIDELGGSVLASGNGMQPSWTRVAVMTVVADAPGAVTYSLSQSRMKCATYGGGAVPWENVALGSVTILQGDTVAADFDADGDVDGTDFMTFVGCYNGSMKPPLSTCASLQTDLDGDGDVDVFDFTTFSNCFNGTNNSPGCQ